ncbi:MAG: GIY-YIG nuclease family protein [Candidatus Omnitrophica bacterium]|nr:GIY-YIG nuclease family protein [Candidatus Omnitrophota bacterium]
MNPAPPKWYYVYLLRSKEDSSIYPAPHKKGGIYPRPSKMGGIYIGCTSNLSKRLQEHKEGKNYSTKKLLPVELIYFEAYKSKEDAFEREKRLKYYSSALRNLKLRLQNTFGKGGAG